MARYVEAQQQPGSPLPAASHTVDHRNIMKPPLPSASGKPSSYSAHQEGLEGFEPRKGINTSEHFLHLPGEPEESMECS